MRSNRAQAVFCLTIAGFSGALAQTPPAFDPQKEAAAQAAFEQVPDSPGTGSYPALKEQDPSLPDHVVYRPADLKKVGPIKLGVVAWGNGGCAADGAGSRLHLEEIASHGYVVIANGTILSGPGSPPHSAAAMPANGAKPGSPDFKPPPPATRSAGLLAALDWILHENGRRDSPYYGRINPRWVAVSGWSCGGLQALEVAGDPRIRTVVIHSSGIFSSANPLPDLHVTKDDLKKLHSSVIYILGGPTDIAYQNGMDDYQRISGVPAVVVNLAVGHGGTFRDANGGRAASVAVSWLDWQLKGDRKAAARFVGADCELCRDSQWTIERKNMPTRVE